MEIVENAVRDGRSLLDEHESKLVLAAYGVPVTRERLLAPGDDPSEAFGEIGFPLVLKACSADLAHKTEQGLVIVGLRDPDEAARAFIDMAGKLSGQGGILVQEMLAGKRELVAGLTRDPQFGPCVMFGLGGIFTEVLDDVVFRVAPLEPSDAMEMMDEIRGRKILGPVRGMEPVDRKALADLLVRVGRIGLDHDRIKEIDINPVIIEAGRPKAADALIVLDGGQ